MKDQFQVSRLADAYGFMLCDTFEELLRLISVEYLEKCWHKFTSKLEDSEILKRELRYGYLSRDVPVVDVEMNPLSYFGWVTDRTKPLGDPAEIQYSQLSQQLKKFPPRICWGASNEAYHYDTRGNDHERGLELCLYYATDEVSEWNPHYILTEGSPTGLWREIIEAVHSHDDELITKKLTIARAKYSSVGYKILERGIALWKKTGLW
jgi:hypothetical protein